MDTYVIMPVGAGEHAGKLGEPVGADLRVCPNNVCPNDGCDEPVGAGRTRRGRPTCLPK